MSEQNSVHIASKSHDKNKDTKHRTFVAIAISGCSVIACNCLLHPRDYRAIHLGVTILRPGSHSLPSKPSTYAEIDLAYCLVQSVHLRRRHNFCATTFRSITSLLFLHLCPYSRTSNLPMRIMLESSPSSSIYGHMRRNGNQNLSNESNHED